MKKTKSILKEEDFKNVFDVQKSQKDQILSIYEGIVEKADKEEEEVDEFKHHRLMAGYHSSKADELADESLKLNSASDKNVHGVAKEKKGEETRHRKTAEEHREKAKSHHDEKTHGSWNDTMPSKVEALRYGSKQAKEADKKADEIEKEENYKKDVKKGEELFEKSNEGSRGGKVIGHTKSGKPVYDNSSVAGNHIGFTKEDHADAYKVHSNLMSRTDGSKYHYYMSHRDSHKEIANKMANEQEFFGKKKEISSFEHTLSKLAEKKKEETVENPIAERKIKETKEKILNPELKTGLRKAEAFKVLGV